MVAGSTQITTWATEDVDEPTAEPQPGFSSLEQFGSNNALEYLCQAPAGTMEMLFDRASRTVELLSRFRFT